MVGALLTNGLGFELKATTRYSCSST